MRWKLLKRGPAGQRCTVCSEPVDRTLPCWKGKGETGHDVYIESCCTGDHGCAILLKRFGASASRKAVKNVCSLLSYLGARDIEDFRRAS